MQSGYSFYAPAILESHLLLDTQQAPVFLYSLDYVSNGFPWASAYKGNYLPSLKVFIHDENHFRSTPRSGYVLHIRNNSRWSRLEFYKGGTRNSGFIWENVDEFCQIWVSSLVSGICIFLNWSTRCVDI